MATYAQGDRVEININDFSPSVRKSLGLNEGDVQQADVTAVRTESTILGDVDLYDLDVVGHTVDLSNVREEKIIGLAA